MANLILIGVGEPFRGKLRGWARAQAIDTLELADAASLAPAATAEPLLCVLALHGEDEAVADRVRALRKALVATPVVVLVSGIGVDRAVELIRTGVADVIEATRSVDDVVARVTRHASRGPQDDELIGASAPMRHLRAEIATVAHLSSPVLVIGETGSGKTTVARSIHRASRRRSGPFVPVDCNTALPGVVERELFGAPASSGAPRERGAVHAAQGGTLFLDDVGALSAADQTRLLGFLERREQQELAVLRAGPDFPRLIAATTRDLRDEVTAGRFRADLYFRLATFPLTVPPLRDRIGDVGALVRCGLDHLGRRFCVTPPVFSAELHQAMSDYRWPGNVRELMSLLERAVVRHSGGVFDERQLIATLEGTDAVGSGMRGDEGSAVSRAAVAGALVATGGNIARAARRLGIPRTTLRYRIGVLGLDALLPRD